MPVWGDRRDPGHDVRTEPTVATSKNELDAMTRCCAPVIDSPLTEHHAGDLSTVYAALGDPVRLRLLSLIAANGELCSCDLLEPLEKSQPTISHHTKILAAAGLIVGKKLGRWVYWRIEPTQAEFVRAALERPAALPAAP